MRQWCVSYQRDPLTRLRAHAQQEWNLASHVLPYEMAAETLPGRRSSERARLLHGSRDQVVDESLDDGRPREGDAGRPTGHLNSRQVACVNHLEPARVDAAARRSRSKRGNPFFTARRSRGGYVAYEWIGTDWLPRRARRARRGAKEHHLARRADVRRASRWDTLIAIEWKYLECYGPESVATSNAGPTASRPTTPARTPRLPDRVGDTSGSFRALLPADASDAAGMEDGRAGGVRRRAPGCTCMSCPNSTSRSASAEWSARISSARRWPTSGGRS